MVYVDLRASLCYVALLNIESYTSAHMFFCDGSFRHTTFCDNSESLIRAST